MTPPRRSRLTTGVAVLATLVGIWLGVGAPDVSPVTPPVPPTTVTGS